MDSNFYPTEELRVNSMLAKGASSQAPYRQQNKKQTSFEMTQDQAQTVDRLASEYGKILGF